MNKRKRILLMNTGMGIGGISSSMINAANELSKWYDVSIFCYIPEGELKSRLNESVNVIDSCWMLKAICSSFEESKSRGLKFAGYKIFAKVWSVVFNNRFPVYLAIKRQPKLGYFDLACSFTHEASKHIEYTGLIRVLISKVDSPCKLSWIHCDYNKIEKSTFNYRYYKKMDAIVGCSDSVANAFKANNLGLNVPVETCYNMLDYQLIEKMTLSEQKVKYVDDGIICFSACRLSKVKGITRALHCFSKIMKKNNVYWYIAGDGEQKEPIKEAIKAEKLSDRVFLIGDQLNPFNYMSNADLYLSVSYEEAAPLVFFEAKAVKLPVFSTNTLSAKELLNDTVDYIAENNEKDMTETFDIATRDIDELKRRKCLLDNTVQDNSKSIAMFKKWLND